MGVKDVTVRVSSIDGTWETLGADRARGVWPEGVVLEADPWGSSRASFSLRRDPTAFWPDIGAFTPVEVEVAGSLVWSGRVSDTPSQVSARQMNVQCEGWQYHLDDDVYKTFYVHTDLGAWVDMRSLSGAVLSQSIVAGQPTVGDGVITLGFPANTAIVPTARSGVALDLAKLGAAGDFSSIAIDWQSSNNAGSINFYCTTTDAEDPGTGGTNLLTFTLASGASGTTAGSTASPMRWLFLYLYWAAGGTPSADVWLRINGIRLFRSGTYNGGGGSSPSVLRASHVVTDALDRATVLLSSDRSLVQSTSFDIPSYAPDWQTPRAAISAVNAYHDWQPMVDVDRRLVYRPKPSRPEFEVGAWSAIQDDDASMNSGDEIYNGALVTAQSPDGKPVSVVRRTADTLFGSSAPVQPTNPSFDTNLTGWTGDAISRSTTVFDSTPASMLMTSAVIPGAFAKTSSWSGAWEEGLQYKLRMRIRREYASAFLFTIEVRVGGGNNNAVNDTVLMSGLTVGQFTTYESPAFTVPANASPELVLTVPSGGAPATGTPLLYVDTVQFTVSRPTLVDRRGFRRRMILPVSSNLPSDGTAAGVIGDTWLGGHKTTPFKGSVSITGDEGLRNILTGAPVPLEQLLLNTGQLLRFSDRIDPDTGAHSRDGRIAAVTYTPASDTAQATIDSSRSSFEALMSRLAAVQGG